MGFAQRNRAHRRAGAACRQEQDSSSAWKICSASAAIHRRNTPLFKKFHAKALDGHPTPATPFVRLATGASGVGLPASFGLAWAAADVYGENAPRVHIIEGEGGMTPGRVAEALAAAGTASLDNVILHIDWNQASIDSNRVCREGETPGEYVQWTPAELAYLHDWNVIYVPDGFDWQQITFAQRLALDLHNGQPTAIVYRTIKGWRYGIEGRASHGAGHGLCSNAFFTAVEPLLPKDETLHPALRRRATMQLRNEHDHPRGLLLANTRHRPARARKRGRRRWRRWPRQLRAAQNRLEHARPQTTQPTRRGSISPT